MMETTMRSMTLLAVALATVATSAMAQDSLLTGQYRCVKLCRPGFELAPIFITQNGDELNIVDEAGVAGRASLDWFSRSSGFTVGRRARSTPRTA